MVSLKLIFVMKAMLTLNLAENETVDKLQVWVSC